MDDYDRRIKGLYAVTPEWTDEHRLLDAVRAALRGGAAAVQLRCKSAEPRLRRRLADTVLMACRDAGARFIVNDDVELALAVGADGVHLGRDDMPCAQARERLGSRPLIGVSCYDDYARAQAAVAEGADQVAFGSMFLSQVKPGAVRAPLSLLAQARGAGLNVLAIGGITVANAPMLAQVGADAIAVITELFAAGEPAAIEAAARALVAAFESPAPISPRA